MSTYHQLIHLAREAEALAKALEGFDADLIPQPGATEWRKRLSKACAAIGASSPGEPVKPARKKKKKTAGKKLSTDGSAGALT